MSRDKLSGSDPEFSMSAEDEAFLRLVEDSYEAAGRPKDQESADRVWGKLEARLGAEVKSDGKVRAITSAKQKKRNNWTYLSGALGVAAALVLFVNFRQTSELPGTMQTRGPESGFAAEIKVYDQSENAPIGTAHRVQVKVLADADGHVALFRQQGEEAPVFVSNLAYKKDQGEMNVLEEEAPSGTRYCIVGAKDQEGLKHLVELIPELWAYLPTRSCYSVP